MNVAIVCLNNDKHVVRGVGYVASAILEAGYSIGFFDTAWFSDDEVVRRIVGGNYDVLLISATTLYYPRAKRLAQAVKVVKPIPIVLGGIHATILKGALLEDCPQIDYLCIGEGEQFVVEFLDRLGTTSLKETPGLAYRNGSSIQVNAVSDCCSLDTLPKFHYELFRSESIVQDWPLPGFCYVYATRGCPYRCSYCCNSCYLDLYHGSYLRTRSVDAVIDELRELTKSYPVRVFYFGDEMILFNVEYCKELFTRLRKELGLPYGCMARVECISPEVVDLFADTGCCYVGMGIECGDEMFRQSFLNRHMTNDRIVEAFRILRTVPGIMLTSFNMHGYPVPNDAELTQATKALNAMARPDNVRWSRFFPFPGTKLYEYCVEHDLIDWNKMNSVNDYFSESVLRGL
jgi:anaerobic magnesium-protoporphyrin IX monomethyl ester cyclase